MHKDIINESLDINLAEKNGESSREPLQSSMYFLFSHIQEVKVEVEDRGKKFSDRPVHLIRECVEGNRAMEGPGF